MSQPIGYFTLVLHSHLPYVQSHGKWPHGTDWLHEAAAESYIPLLNVLNQLVEEGISPKITIGISPILGEQLADGNFRDDFVGYLEEKIDAAVDDRSHFLTYHYAQLADLAKMWQEFYNKTLEDFQVKYNADLIGAFRKLQDDGHIEIITCGATHGYFPLLSQDTSLQAQTKMAVKSYKRLFGKAPRGMWLPECAYRPRYTWTPPVPSKAGRRPYMRKGTEEFLSENGIEYTCIDAHLLKGGEAIGIYIHRYEALRKLWGAFSSQYQILPEDEEKTPHQAYLVSSNGYTKNPVALLTRDPDTAAQVWSGEWGYPGDGNYLDFHKKHFPGRHRYWRVTSPKADLADKLEYDPKAAQVRIPENAAHFVKLVQDTLSAEYKESGKPGVLCAPFDTELFGHWWFEGPQFIYHVLKGIAQSSDTSGIALSTGSQYLDISKPSTTVSIQEGSWGEGGFHYIWLNEWTHWTWKHIYDDEVDLQELIDEYGKHEDSRIQDVLKQCARELLLLQSSDWQFLISTWAARDYAEMRLIQHHQNFVRLTQLVEHLGKGTQIDSGEWNFYLDCIKQDHIFPDLELEWFRDVENPV